MVACACAAGPWLYLVGQKSFDTDADPSKVDVSAHLPCHASTAGFGKLGRTASTGALRAARTQAAFSSIVAARFAAGPFYDVGDALGEGAFGVVVRARSRKHHCECGLKIIAQAKYDEREVSVHAVLDHPHIARLIDSFRRGGSHYLAVELCQGGELYTAVRAMDRLPEADARVMFRQIMSAVAYMHSNGVAHRDLKLENFLLERRGVPLTDNSLKLIDFGFATRFVPGCINMCTRCGSQGYVAPEILAGRRYDERCDVFSCGVLLHCLLCGKLPFKDERRVAKGEIRFGGREVRSTLSAEARHMAEWTLTREPTDRPSSQDVFDASWLCEGPQEEVDAERQWAQQPSAVSHPPIASMPSTSSSVSSGRLEYLFDTLRSFRGGRSGLKRRSFACSVGRSASSVMAGGRRAAHVAAAAVAPRTARREPRHGEGQATC